MEARPPSQLGGPCVCRDTSSDVCGLTQCWPLLKGEWDSGDAPAVCTVKNHGIRDSHASPRARSRTQGTLRRRQCFVPFYSKEQ